MPPRAQPPDLDGLIEAMNIFRRYGNPNWPFNCTHDTLTVCINPEDITDQGDLTRLAEIGFHPDNTGEAFYSYRYGSA